MDSTFIFIFFLLMSAQFLKIYEIGSDAPTVKLVDPNNKKDPLNLSLEVTQSGMTLKSGMENKVVAVLPKNGTSYDLTGLSQHLFNIKKAHADESSIILRPDAAVPYKELVRIMDTARIYPKDQGDLAYKNDKGEMVKTRDLFNQIIFETLI